MTTMTTREKLKLMDEIRRKNDAAFAEAARQRESKSRKWKAVKDMLREIMTLVAPAVIGMLAGILVVWNAR